MEAENEMKNITGPKSQSTCGEEHFPFTTRAGEWQIFVNGRVVACDFGCKGAALAGIAVQLRRDARIAAATGK